MKGNQHLTALGGRAGRKTQLIIGVAARFVQNCTLRDSVHRRTGPPFRREGQDGRHMLVRGPGIPDQRCGLLVAAPVLAKGHERLGIEPERAWAASSSLSAL
jgi:hypothetical protein